MPPVAPASPIIDFHTHPAPDLWRRYLPDDVETRLRHVRSRIRGWLRPYSSSLHEIQTSMRLLPEPLRAPLDQLAPVGPLPHFLVESTPDDLKAAMDASGVSHAVIIAHPPTIPNEFVLELAQERPELLAAVNIPAGTPRPSALLKEYASRGAKLLKIHPAADGEGADSPRYRALLKAAEGLGLPVILHTGCMHSRVLYRDPEMGKVERFIPWFEKHRELRFMLAHMNFHEPGIALDLGEEHPNLLVDTSWQPAETIGEAVRRLGPERVFFGSDWPIVGHNIAIGISRIRDCVDSGFFGEAEAAMILGGNAARILGLEKA